MTKDLKYFGLDKNTDVSDLKVSAFIKKGKGWTWNRILRTTAEFMVTKAGEFLDPADVIRVRMTIDGTQIVLGDAPTKADKAKARKALAPFETSFDAFAVSF